MKAIWYTRQGVAHDVLQFGEQPEPHAATGEVRIRLQASGVNPADIYRRAGPNFQMDGPLIIPNSDGAGVVDEVGDGAPQELKGKRVWLYNGQRNGRVFGTAAQYIALNADLVRELPRNAGFAEGACLGIPAMTAHVAVARGGDLKGRNVFISGGAGAVGNYAIQWAKRFGACVITTVSSDEKAAHAKAAGANMTLNYKSADVAAAIREFTGGKGLAHVVDLDFGANIGLLVPLMAAGGTLAYFATKGNLAPVFPADDFMRRNLTLSGIVLNGVPLAQRHRAQDDITQWLKDGGMQHTISSVHPLAKTAEAHDAVQAGTKRGTVVVECTL